MMRLLVTTLLLCATLTLAVQTGTAQDDTFDTIYPRNPDIAYNNITDRQVLDVYMPEERDDPLPTLFMIHGGGFVFGSKGLVRDIAEYFADQGYAVVAPSYRLAPRFTYPAQIEDMFCALAWTTHYADTFGFDINRIALVGESAGANIAAMLGTIDNPAQFLTNCHYTLPDNFKLTGVAAYYMPVDLSTCECEDAIRFASLYLGISRQALSNGIEQLREQWAEASPYAWLDPNDPPFLLVHGDRDELVPISESRGFLRAAQAIGIAVDLVVIPGANHGFFSRLRNEANQEALPYLEDFLARITGSPKVATVK